MKEHKFGKPEIIAWQYNPTDKDNDTYTLTAQSYCVCGEKAWFSQGDHTMPMEDPEYHADVLDALRPFLTAVEGYHLEGFDEPVKKRLLKKLNKKQPRKPLRKKLKKKEVA